MNDRIVLPIITSDDLEKLAKILGTTRKTYLFFFRESDKKFRERLLDRIYMGKYQHYSVGYGDN